ncbi:LemA protein [Desulfobotulus alkaliphilus]|uniref:LemA protein n=1 Tax=Desulfobotulus alkaliphilus TaxID=622671 RepID=A0A562RMN9_9BACT|nr:LemA family protein [Desulfobotulus alkaliphilus]TWI70317.1 LemA protein [Desulfobotulus alkaliphilus]
MEWIIGIGVCAVLVVIFTIVTYNKLVSLKNRFQNAFAQIDVQLTRRYDLIPNLVETAKAYMTHERETLEAVIAARNQASSGLRKAAADPGNPEAMKALAVAEQGLGGMLGRFMALSESYPQLQASENMKQLSEELSSTENRVAFARQAYNDAVMTYNVKREQFPANIVASQFRFTAAALLEIEDQAKRQVPKVSFS